MELPKRKIIRIPDYDYSTPGSYFVTVCLKDRKNLLWNGMLCDPENVPLSGTGRLVQNAIEQIPQHHNAISVDKYCIMPDHIHLLISVNTDADGRQTDAPTISTVVGGLKRWVSMQLGYSIWQKSFVDRVIRNEKGYLAAWQYIENNPIKMDLATDHLDMTQF